MALERDKHVAQRALLTLDEAQLLDIYRKMVIIRRFEEKAAEMYTRGKITGFCHLYAGEEAVAVGAIQALYDKDYVVCNCERYNPIPADPGWGINEEVIERIGEIFQYIAEEFGI
jgi:pyruvate dehydrogenase E1 component alpha subunit